METIRILKSSDDETEDICIEIGGDIRKFHLGLSAGLKPLMESYDHQAKLLFDALIGHLPQGTRRRLLWRLMEFEARVSLRQGSALE